MFIKSLDDMDRASFHAGPAPFDSPPEYVTLHPGAAAHPPERAVLSLDGEWAMAEGGPPEERLNADWPDAIPAAVPGSVHTALVRAGRIPDPTVGLNDRVAREQSFKTWWFKKAFERPVGMEHPRLYFGGVAVNMTVWLNGEELGCHEGMFGGPEFDIAGRLKPVNTLTVRIDPAPYVESTGQPNDFFTGMNVGWLYTTVFNNVYGWHYSNIPAIGIWRSVWLEDRPAVQLTHPFIGTHNVSTGEIDFYLRLEGDGAATGLLTGTFEPENFAGAPWHFIHTVVRSETSTVTRLRCAIPDAKPWQPVDTGFPHLYRATLSLAPGDGSRGDTRSFTFGIRTVEMAPLPGGPDPEKYNWTFVINGRPMFVKGANWCTLDPLMDFSRERYDRFLSLAAAQHIQMLRAWGSGMPETDDFYDVADRYGIMVMQEWPTAWNSHREGWQPYRLLEETVTRNTLRLRNHPSLVMWGGGNESGDPHGPAIDMMGRASIEMDGARPFHRGEPWGGSLHNYDCWWGKAPLDRNLTLKADFLGEFGIASLPDVESVRRYLPDHEQDAWPPAPGSAFCHHTPVFNLKEDMARLTQYAGYFTHGGDLETFVLGSQLAQATGVRHTLELARTRWPACSGALYYKLNDNYPAASWSSVDWYGATKLAYHAIQDAFAPLHACALFSTLQPNGSGMSLPVYLVDDADALRDSAWEATLRAFDATLSEIARANFSGHGSIDRAAHLGVVDLRPEQTASAPLLVVVDIRQAGITADRSWYWLNFAPAESGSGVPGNLFGLPKTELETTIQNPNAVTITNRGGLPAVGVHIEAPGAGERFTVEDSLFWLDPGESRTIWVTRTTGLRISAWNAVDGQILT